MSAIWGKGAEAGNGLCKVPGAGMGVEKQTEIMPSGRTRDGGPSPGVRECLECWKQGSSVQSRDYALQISGT